MIKTAFSFYYSNTSKCHSGFVKNLIEADIFICELDSDIAPKRRDRCDNKMARREKEESRNNMNFKPRRFLKPARFSLSDFSFLRNGNGAFKVVFLLAFFMLFFLQRIAAQNEWLFNKYPGKLVSVMDETYDGGILVQIFGDTSNTPVYLIKYSTERKVLWEKTLNNISFIQSIVNTYDSSFVLTADVYKNPIGNPTVDSSGNIAILKFDKCANLQWGKYIKSAHGGAWPVNVIVSKNDYYMCAEDINGYDDHLRKPVTLIKFDKNGTVLHYNSYEGDAGMIYQLPNSDTLYLVQSIYISIDSDTTTEYAFSGVRSVDTSLNPLNRTVIGYNQVYNGVGPLAFSGNTLRQACAVFQNSGRRQAMFSSFNKDLIETGNILYDTTEKLDYLGPLYSVSHQDTLIVCNLVQTRTSDTSFTSLRMYDNNYNLIKESVINKNWLQETESFLPLRNGGCIVSTLNFDQNTGNIDNSSLYLFDRQLNSIVWPTVPPTKGYDWACSSAIPDTQTINIASVVTPVYVAPDYSQPDWQALTSSMYLQPYTISGFCSNSSTVFTPFQNLSSPSFHWDFGDSTSGTADTSTQRTSIHFYKTPGEYIVHLIAWNYAGIIDTFARIVNISAGLYPVKTDTTLCNGETITLDAGNPGAQYYWNDSDTSRTKTVGPGKYWVRVNNGSCVITDTFHISGVSSYKIDLGNDTTLAKGKTLTLHSGYPATTWSTGAVGDSIQVSQSGTYWATLKVGKCNISDTIVVTFKSGIDNTDNKSISGLNLYPNPAQNLLNYSFYTDYTETFNIAIYDINGKVVLEQKFNSITGINSNMINIGSLTPGNYIFGLSSGNSSTTRPFEIESK